MHWLQSLRKEKICFQRLRNYAFSETLFVKSDPFGAANALII